MQIVAGDDGWDPLAHSRANHRTMLAAIVTLVGAAYPLGLCAFRHGIKEIGFSKHESAWPYVISSAALAISALVFGSSVTTAMAGLVLSALSYRVQILGPRFTAASMEGKVCIVTGSSSGIGLEIAQYLIGLDAHVILGAPSRARAQRGGRSGAC